MNPKDRKVSIISACTNRKRHAPKDWLQAGTLRGKSQTILTKRWIERLERASSELETTYIAKNLYCGRGFVEARKAAEDAKHYIVSAGLGLISSESPVPSYSLTVSGQTADSMPTLLPQFNIQQWWQALEASPFMETSLQRLVKNSHLVILALPSNYITLIERDLKALPSEEIAKMRIFGVPDTKVPSQLKPCVMPIDQRLEGKDSQLPGTQTDFAVRAARLFMEQIYTKSSDGTAKQHFQQTEKFIEKWRYPTRADRKKLSDDEIKIVIRKSWNMVSGRSTHMLKHLRRDLGYACEQSRFKTLFKQVEAERN